MHPVHPASRAIRTWGAGLALLLTVGSCNNDSATGLEELPPLPGAVASDPGPMASFSSAAGSAVTVAAIADAAQATYVSLVPGTFPDGVKATIRHPSTNQKVEVGMVDGGFDPVTIRASSGVRLEVDILKLSGSTERYALVVPARKRPVVVRTSPPRGKRDVVLTMMATVIFSEPIDSRTVNGSTVRLVGDASEIPVRLQFNDAEHLSLSIIPESELDLSTTYAIVISDGVRDFDGESLEGAVYADFTTVNVPTGDVRITATTSGEDQDGDGYTVVLDTRSATVPSNGSVVLAELPEGDRALGISNINGNCTPAPGNPTQVRVERSKTIDVAIAITCTKFVATIEVSTVTTGADPDPDGYSIFIEGAQQARVPSTGKVRVTTTAGLKTVELKDVTENCVVTPASRSVNVAATGPAAFVSITFGVNCTSTTAMRVVTETNGVDADRDGYLVIATRPTIDERVLELTPNDTVIAAQLAVGDYLVTLMGVSPNCEVAGNNPRVVTTASATTSELKFSISCTTAALFAFSATHATAEHNLDERDIYVAKANGSESIRLTIAPGIDDEPDWAPGNGKIVFVSNRDGNREIYVMNADGSNQTRLTVRAEPDYGPKWSPDGSKIAFVSERDGNSEIYVMNADGTNVVRLTNNNEADDSPSWSPNGAKIAFRAERLLFGAGNGEIATMNADGTGFTRLTVDGADDTGPAWSPDGSKIAFARFTSTEDTDDGSLDQSDIFVINADGSSATRVGGVRRPFYWAWFYYLDDEKRPAWSPDGKTIAFTLSTCASDGHCHQSWSIGMIQLGKPGWVEYRQGHAFNPAWRR